MPYFDYDAFIEWADLCRFGPLKDDAVRFCRTVLLWDLEPEDARMRAGRCFYKYASMELILR